MIFSESNADFIVLVKMIFITVLMTATCCKTAALVTQVITWVVMLNKSGSSNFCKDLPTVTSTV